MLIKKLNYKHGHRIGNRMKRDNTDHEYVNSHSLSKNCMRMMTKVQAFINK